MEIVCLEVFDSDLCTYNLQLWCPVQVVKFERENICL